MESNPVNFFLKKNHSINLIFLGCATIPPWMGIGGCRRRRGRQEKPRRRRLRHRHPPPPSAHDVQQHVPHNVRPEVRERGGSHLPEAKSLERREESLGAEL